MKKILVLFILGIIVIGISCKSQKEFSLTEQPSADILPGVVAVNDSLLIDKSEMSHIGWMEYLFYLKTYYGRDSEEFLNALPDSNAWKDDDSLYYFYDHWRHPSYRNYPMTCVSQQQVLDYSKWRADRVMEGLLMRNGMLNHDTIRSSETVFTIKKYYKRELNRITSDSLLMYYPEYRLPSLDELIYTKIYDDSINDKYYGRKRLFTKRENLIYRYRHCYFIWDNCTEPFDLTYGKCVKYSPSGIYYLTTNANEWTSQENLVIGRIWHDTIESGNIIDTTSYYKKANPYTGFRNIAEWKKYEPDSID